MFLIQIHEVTSMITRIILYGHCSAHFERFWPCCLHNPHGWAHCLWSMSVRICMDFGRPLFMILDRFGSKRRRLADDQYSSPLMGQNSKPSWWCQHAFYMACEQVQHVQAWELPNMKSAAITSMLNKAMPIKKTMSTELAIWLLYFKSFDGLNKYTHNTWRFFNPIFHNLTMHDLWKFLTGSFF